MLLADPTFNPSRSICCPGRMSSAAMGTLGLRGTMLGGSSMTAPQAAQQLGIMFSQLQQQAKRILNTVGTSADPALSPLYRAHCAAVQAYLNTARDVFAQFKARGLKITQIAYDIDGRQVGTYNSPEPVAPAVFSPCDVTGGKISSSGQVLGSPGFGVVVIPLAVWIIAIIVAGATAAVAVHEIVVNWPTQPTKQAEAQRVWVQSYLDCVDRTKASSPGVAMETIYAQCKGLTPPPDAPSSFSWTFVALGVGAVGSIALLMYWQHRTGRRINVSGSRYRRRR